ncbi:ATP-dependent RNA helicase dbp6 [Entophlyctis luteolus]|nr:ATP-dependent RNA helicase dbp6 [Entophlyctis luteolus]
MFSVERYGQDTPIRHTPKEHSRHRQSHWSSTRSHPTSEKKRDWQQLKHQKKKWAVEIEKEIDARGSKSIVASNHTQISEPAVDDIVESAPDPEPNVEDSKIAVETNFHRKITGTGVNVAKWKSQKHSIGSQGLPSWLANPVRIPASLTEHSDEAGISNPTYNLSKHTQERLIAMEITHLFPVQQVVLPKLLKSRYSSSPRTPPGDLLVSSSTGSGKTLAYCLPILEHLLTSERSCSTARVIPRLRALIVVPTRDLAVQVKTTFEQLSRGSNIRIGVVTGSVSFHVEQEMLVEPSGRDVGTEGPLLKSKLDVLVATPGRLTDHMKGTPGFSLRHLRFLVLDEADRLLVQDYQGWLNLVLKSVKGDHLLGHTVSGDDAESHLKARYDRYLSNGCVSFDIERQQHLSENGREWIGRGFNVDELGLPLHNALSFRHEQIQRLDDNFELRVTNGPYTALHQVPLQKLLFSATLTRNPEKIASLELENPTYIAVSTSINQNQSDGATKTEDAEGTQHGVFDDDLDMDKFNAPPTLNEHMIVVKNTAEKPLVLMHLLFNLKLRGLLVFTRSVEAAHRLASLIQAAAEAIPSPTPRTTAVARAITSDLSTVDRRRLVADFVQARVAVLVCSDVMARGIDLGSSVMGVVNYDVPAADAAAKSYVHRIGRTARAGRDGDAWSIVEEKEARWFKRDVVAMIHRSGSKSVARMKVTEADAEKLRHAYETALHQLSEMVKKAR